MAQAAVDLPDPKQRAGSSSPMTATPTNVDDLLAQLAGEEIDRLLAEAETGRPPAAEEPARHEPAPAIPAEPRVTHAQVEPTAKAVADPVDAAMSAQLDELFNQLESQDVPAVVEPKPVATVAEVPATHPRETGAPTVVAEVAIAAAHPQPVASPPVAEAPAATAEIVVEAAPLPYASVPELATSSAERDALELDLSDDEPAPDAAAERPTRLVRFLEVLNAPLIAAPEMLRELVGKIALVTLFNAVAVLAYVLIFRRPHH